MWKIEFSEHSRENWSFSHQKFPHGAVLCLFPLPQQWLLNTSWEQPCACPAEGPSSELWSQLGIRAPLVGSHRGRKRLVNVVHYYKQPH